MQIFRWAWRRHPCGALLLPTSTEHLHKILLWTGGKTISLLMSASPCIPQIAFCLHLLIRSFVYDADEGECLQKQNAAVYQIFSLFLLEENCLQQSLLHQHGTDKFIKNNCYNRAKQSLKEKELTAISALQEPFKIATLRNWSAGSIKCDECNGLINFLNHFDRFRHFQYH